MAKKPKKKEQSPAILHAEERVETIKAEIAQALIHRNTLSTSASDDEKAAAAARVEQLQAQHHEAAQHVLAIKREESVKIEQEHKEKKQRQKQLKASRQAGRDAERHEDTAGQSRHSSPRIPIDRDALDAQMDAANEEDLFLERQRLAQLEDRESGKEIAHLRQVAEKLRKKEEAEKRREARKHEKREADEKAEAARLKAEKEANTKVRQQAALQRAEEEKAKKRQQRADREARAQAENETTNAGKFGQMLRRLFGGRG